MGCNIPGDKMDALLLDNLQAAGGFLLDHVFVEYDNVPVLFTCKNSGGEIFLCRYISEWTEYHLVVSKVSVENIQRLVSKAISIRKCLLNGGLPVDYPQNFSHENPNIFTMVIRLKNGEVQRSVFSGANNSDLPTADSFLKSDASAENYVNNLSKGTRTFNYKDSSFVNGDISHRIEAATWGGDIGEAWSNFGSLIAIHNHQRVATKRRG